MNYQFHQQQFRERLAADIEAGAKPVLHSSQMEHWWPRTVAAVWANNEQDAFGELIDSGLGDCFLVSQESQAEATEEEREEWARLGNAGEPCNLDYAWIQQVRLDPAQDCRLLCAFAEARGAGMTTLEK